MRAIPILLTAAILAGCMTQPPAPTRSAKGQADFQRLTEGKVAGAPIACLPPSARTRNMVTIDDSTVAFEDGRNRTYVNHLHGSCSSLDSGFYTLVTRSHGSSSLCTGDMADVMDVRNGISVGSCSLGEFIPYTRS